MNTVYEFGDGRKTAMPSDDLIDVDIEDYMGGDEGPDPDSQSGHAETALPYPEDAHDPAFAETGWTSSRKRRATRKTASGWYDHGNGVVELGHFGGDNQVGNSYGRFFVKQNENGTYDRVDIGYYAAVNSVMGDEADELIAANEVYVEEQTWEWKGITDPEAVYANDPDITYRNDLLMTNVSLAEAERLAEQYARDLSASGDYIASRKRSSRKQAPVPTLTYLTDPEHGWLGVPISLFPDAPSFSTGYSYYDSKTNTIWLEEDEEAPAFKRAHEGEFTIEHTNAYYDAWVRSLPVMQITPVASRSSKENAVSKLTASEAARLRKFRATVQRNAPKVAFEWPKELGRTEDGITVSQHRASGAIQVDYLGDNDDDYLRSMTYFGYTVEEAIDLFREELGLPDAGYIAMQFGSSKRSRGSRKTALPDYKCSQCGDITKSNFPGDLCLACWEQSPESQRMVSAEELVSMWGGPVRRRGSRKTAGHADDTLIRFYDYVMGFYGNGGVYDMGATYEQVQAATEELLTSGIGWMTMRDGKDVQNTAEFEGDSIDREFVRYYLETMFGLSEKTAVRRQSNKTASRRPAGKVASRRRGTRKMARVSGAQLDELSERVEALGKRFEEERVWNSAYLLMVEGRILTQMSIIAQDASLRDVGGRDFPFAIYNAMLKFQRLHPRDEDGDEGSLYEYAMKAVGVLEQNFDTLVESARGERADSWSTMGSRRRSLGRRKMAGPFSDDVDQYGWDGLDEDDEEEKVLGSRRKTAATYEEGVEDGRAAFHAGKYAVPYDDEVARPKLVGQPGESLSYLKGWHRGWAEENLKPNVPGRTNEEIMNLQRAIGRRSTGSRRRKTAMPSPDKRTVVEYQIVSPNGYRKTVYQRDEAVLVQLQDPAYRAVVIYSDGTEETIYS